MTSTMIAKLSGTTAHRPRKCRAVVASQRLGTAKSRTERCRRRCRRSHCGAGTDIPLGTPVTSKMSSTLASSAADVPRGGQHLSSQAMTDAAFQRLHRASPPPFRPPSQHRCRCILVFEATADGAGGHSFAECVLTILTQRRMASECATANETCARAGGIGTSIIAPRARKYRGPAIVRGECIAPVSLTEMFQLSRPKRVCLVRILSSFSSPESPNPKEPIASALAALRYAHNFA